MGNQPVISMTMLSKDMSISLAKKLESLPLQQSSPSVLAGFSFSTVAKRVRSWGDTEQALVWTAGHKRLLHFSAQAWMVLIKCFLFHF